MSVIRESYNKAVSAVSDYLSNDGLMVGAKNPTPYFRLFRLSSKNKKPLSMPTETPTIWDRFKSSFLPKAHPIDENIMRFVTSIVITNSVGGSDKKKPKNECQVNLQFSVQEALDQIESLKNTSTVKAGDFVQTPSTPKPPTGEWYLDFPYFANAQKLDEKLFITAGYSDLEPEDCVLDVVNLEDGVVSSDKEGKTSRKVTKKGLVVKKGIRFRPYEVVFGGYVTRPIVTGGENGLISLNYTVTNLLSNPVSVPAGAKQQGAEQSPASKKNAEFFAKELEKLFGSQSPEQLLKKYETNGDSKFYEKLEQILKARIMLKDAPADVQKKLAGNGSSSNYVKVLDFTLASDTYLLLDIPKNYIPYDEERYGTDTDKKSTAVPSINIANLNADKPPSFSYSKSFSDFLHKVCSTWGLSYMEYYTDDGKTVIHITPMTEFLKPGSKLLSSFEKDDPAVADKHALLFRYGVEVVSFSYNQKPAIDVQDQTFTATVWSPEASDWVTYKINQKAIEDYYTDAPDKGAMFKQLFEWAKGDPDAFIIYFTNMAGEFAERKVDPEKIPQGAGITLSMKMKHPIPGLRPGLSVVFDVGVENPDSIDVNKYSTAVGADPTQILPVFVSRPIYQITKVVTKLEAGGTIYSQEIECEG